MEPLLCFLLLWDPRARGSWGPWANGLVGPSLAQGPSCDKGPSSAQPRLAVFFDAHNVMNSVSSVMVQVQKIGQLPHISMHNRGFNL